MTGRDTVTELRQLLEKATPGPWTDTTIGHRTQGDAAERARKSVMATRVHDDPKHKIKCTDLTFVDTLDGYAAMTGNGPDATNNAALIAALRNAAPALLDAIDQLQTMFHHHSIDCLLWNDGNPGEPDDRTGRENFCSCGYSGVSACLQAVEPK
jgi:hypothetical protein